MSKQSELVKRILLERKNYNDLESIAIACKILFKAVLEDEEAAKELLNKPNRFVQNLGRVIKFDALIRFKQKYPHLVEQLIHAGFPPNDFAKLMEESVPPASNAAEALAKVDDGRTKLAIDHNPHVKLVKEQPSVDFNGNTYPIVTRHTRQFNNMLFSAGASTSREIIQLDPCSRILKGIYARLKETICIGESTNEILLHVLRVTSDIFQSTHEEIITRSRGRKKSEPTIIALDEYIAAKVGVCRHHALLNAYLLSRLTEDQMLRGDVIHHRQNFREGVHVWNLFRDNNDGKLYSLDSLWYKGVSLADVKPGTLDVIYHCSVEKEIYKRFGKAQVDVVHDKDATLSLEAEVSSIKMSGP